MWKKENKFEVLCRELCNYVHTHLVFKKLNVNWSITEAVRRGRKIYLDGKNSSKKFFLDTFAHITEQKFIMWDSVKNL